MSVYLGLDTSCYTTSLAAVNEAGGVVFDGRVMLQVPPGQRGLRQSEALFQHLRQLERLVMECRDKIAAARVTMVSASTRPRPVADSYLPVFVAGATVGVRPWRPERARLFLPLAIRKAACALPPNPTQHSLPCTYRAAPRKCYRRSVDKADLTSSFWAARRTCTPASLSTGSVLPWAAAVLVCVTESLGRLLREAIAATGLTEVVLGGGVSANKALRDGLTRLLPGARLVFAEPKLSTDNAVGVALLGWDKTKYEVQRTK